MFSSLGGEGGGGFVLLFWVVVFFVAHGCLIFPLLVLIKPRTSRLNGRKEYFVDCGILNNFPIGCFDGEVLNTLSLQYFVLLLGFGVGD